MSNGLESCSIGPDLGPNCLQVIMTKVVARRERVNIQVDWLWSSWDHILGGNQYIALRPKDCFIPGLNIM